MDIIVTCRRAVHEHKQHDLHGYSSSGKSLNVNAVVQYMRISPRGEAKQVKIV